MNLAIPDFYDVENARELCRSCSDAYLLEADKIVGSNITDTSVHLTVRGDDLIVAFRGTANLRNWLTDLDCAFYVCNGYRVHRGFRGALASVFDDLTEAIDKLGCCRRLWVTGHSLGGALAMYFAAIWQGRVDGVYTFGQPRVGDADFTRAYDTFLKSKTFRVIHADDIVPRVPWLLGSYRHAGHEVFYPAPLSDVKLIELWAKELGFPRVEPRIDLPWPAKLIADLPGLARELFYDRLEMLEDHHIATYRALFSDPLINEKQSPATASDMQAAPCACQRGATQGLDACQGHHA